MSQSIGQLYCDSSISNQLLASRVLPANSQSCPFLITVTTPAGIHIFTFLNRPSLQPSNGLPWFWAFPTPRVLSLLKRIGLPPITYTEERDNVPTLPFSFLVSFQDITHDPLFNFHSINARLQTSLPRCAKSPCLVHATPLACNTLPPTPPCILLRTSVSFYKLVTSYPLSWALVPSLDPGHHHTLCQCLRSDP